MRQTKGAYRAYIGPTNREAIDKADKELLQAITEA
jgi:hypothetical protein